MLRRILQDLVEGEIDLDEAERLVRLDAIEEVEHSVLDIGREARTGLPEAVLGEGKSVESFAEATVTMAEARGRVLATRVSREQLEAARAEVPEGFDVEWHPTARALTLQSEPAKGRGTVGVVTGGTSDENAAEEARVTADFLGCSTLSSYDVGVAGIHRLLPPLRDMVEEGVDAVVVAAGREGALPTFVAGLVDAPVIGLPTSNGYGYGGDGEAALMGMLQSCSVLAVVNIDAGFTAGAFAAQVARE
ncbi:MAG: N5-carboxyaminoimidazole ribonucleotide mutase [Methanonatronarchaeales archaeon]|nr:N5-carboxyaminoimidazole ribonucleotide mutase [Methanonatronarchaeales archaeon]